MLSANRAAVRLCKVFWHSPSFEFFSNHSVPRVIPRQRNAFPVYSCVVPGTEVLGQVANGGQMIMQCCSFSQSRVYSNQSEMKEASQSKRSCEAKTADIELGEKRLRLDDAVPCGAVEGGLDDFVSSHEWQYFDMSPEARSRYDVDPIYKAENRDAASDDESTATVEKSLSDGVPQDDMSIDARKEMLLRKIRAIRPWHHTGEAASRATNTGIEFTLMSYNILAQDLLENNFYLYGHCDHNVLNWEFRSQNLLAEIEDAQPDILCLQELTQTHYEEYFLPRLSFLGWNSLYKKRTGGKNDGCAIFFKRSLFELESYISVEYLKRGIRHLDRDNVGLIVVLKPSVADANKDTKLCVATTHLLFNPRRGDIKLSQLQLLLAEMDRVAFRGQSSSGRPKYHPAILCGDMNSEPYSPLYQFLTCGELMYDGLMTGDISGQREGISRGKTIRSTDLHLPQLGLSMDCQYTNVNAQRAGSTQTPYCKIRSGYGYSFAPCKNPPNAVPSFLMGRGGSSSSQMQLPEGCLRHGFDFMSAYKHLTPTGELSVTTHHKKASCIVDYIFYSSGNKHEQKLGKYKKEGPLHLTGTCRLPTSQEIADLGGLPNAALSSDHLSLIAKFFLDLSSCES